MDTTESKNIVRSLYLSFFSTLTVIVLVTLLYLASQYSQKWIVHTNETTTQIHNVSETLLKAEILNTYSFPNFYLFFLLFSTLKF